MLFRSHRPGREPPLKLDERAITPSSRHLVKLGHAEERVFSYKKPAAPGHFPVQRGSQRAARHPRAHAVRRGGRPLERRPTTLGRAGGGGDSPRVDYSRSVGVIPQQEAETSVREPRNFPRSFFRGASRRFAHAIGCTAMSDGADVVSSGRPTPNASGTCPDGSARATYSRPSRTDGVRSA